MNTYRLTLLLCASFLCNNTSAQDTLYWRTKDTLTWSDFKGKPDITKRHLAISSTGISYSFRYSENTFDYKVTAFFSRNSSWKKPSVDFKVLKHEQGHFDITEIFARKLEAELQQLKPDRKTIKKTIDGLAEKIIKEKNEYQKKYDTETGYGTNLSAQHKWQSAIYSQLQR